MGIILPKEKAIYLAFNFESRFLALVDFGGGRTS